MVSEGFGEIFWVIEGRITYYAVIFVGSGRFL